MKLTDATITGKGQLSPRANRKLQRMLAQLEPGARERSRQRAKMWGLIAGFVVSFGAIGVVLWGFLLFLAWP